MSGQVALHVEDENVFTDVRRSSYLNDLRFDGIVVHQIGQVTRREIEI